MYDSIVIGCGFAGATAARELAEKKGHKVLVIDKRSHVGGNCYDRKDEYGILIHQYGPHIFHTNSKKVERNCRFRLISIPCPWYSESGHLIWKKF